MRLPLGPGPFSINYEQFAYENDIGRAQYGRYENGEDLKFSSLLRVLKALGVSLEECFAEGFEEEGDGQGNS